jgi:hypothetical protein
VVDSGDLSPHNAARHGLVPASGPMQLPWMGSKAEALAKAIEGLGQCAEAISRDVVEIVRDQKEVKRVLPKNAWAVVNSTASLSVREALGCFPSRVEIPRVIETSLFANGSLGLMPSGRAVRTRRRILCRPGRRPAACAGCVFWR